ETACPWYSLTPSGVIEECIDPDIKPRPDRPEETCPFSFRNHMAGAVGLVVEGTALVSSQRFTHVLLGFTLDATGNFPAINNPDDPNSTPAFPSKKDKKRERKMRKKNRTDEILRYIGLTVMPEADSRPIIYAAAYAGRTDAFRLGPDGTLPQQPTTMTPKN